MEKKKQFTVFIGSDIYQAIENLRFKKQEELAKCGIKGVFVPSSASMIREILRKELELNNA